MMKSSIANPPMIRAAKAIDYHSAAPLIIQAMEDLACYFVQEKDPSLAIPLFELFFQRTGNQYSFENTLVYEIDHQIAGTITGYDGAYLHQLREPFLTHLSNNYQLKDFYPEDETQIGEFYLDTIGVSPHFQGKGIGSKLIQASIEKAANLNHKRVGLLVDFENPLAKKLYARLGFQTKGIKEFIGGKYEHMQFEL